MRLTEFWSRMSAVFGRSYAESVARDQVLAELGGVTVVDALDRGDDVKGVWRAVAAHFDVPASVR